MSPVYGLFVEIKSCMHELKFCANSASAWVSKKCVCACVCVWMRACEWGKKR